MRCVKMLSVLMLLCLFCLFLPVSIAADGVIVAPVDEAIEEIGTIDLEQSSGEDGDSLLSRSESKKPTDTGLSSAMTSNVNGFVIEDGVLVEYTGLDNEVVVPLGVRRIGEFVFSCDKNLVSVVIPSSVTSIGWRAFSECENLSSITFPDSVTEIESGAFYDCDSIVQIRLPNKLSKISYELFYSCDSLESIVIPDSVSNVEDGAFCSCDSLKNVVIREGVTSIGESFNYCYSLESISVPANVTQIDRTAFNGSDNFIIKGVNGSYAERYAQAMGIPFNAPIVYFEETEMEGYGEDRRIILHVGSARTLNTRQAPADLATTLAWKSSDDSIATVDQNGTVTAVAPGMVNITVNTVDGKGKAAQIAIEVPDLSSIQLSCYDCYDDISVELGELMWIVAEVYTPYSSWMDSEYPVSWSTSDSSVAVIDSYSQTETDRAEAYIKSVGLGKATVTASVGDGGSASVVIQVVRPAPTGISIDQTDPIELHPGDTFALSATVTPESAAQDVEWYSWTNEVATVDANGVVTAVKEGYTTIHASVYNGLYEDSISVEVTPRKPDAVKLNQKGTVTLELGKTLRLKATVTPSDAETTLTWISTKPKIAMVSENGTVTPVKAGTAKITVSTDNGKKASVKVKVVAPPPKRIRITNGKTVNLKAGKKLALKTELKPSYAKTTLTWTSSNKKVATVSAKGVVTAKKVGTATITVKTANGKKASIKIKVK